MLQWWDIRDDGTSKNWNAQHNRLEVSDKQNQQPPYHHCVLLSSFVVNTTCHQRCSVAANTTHIKIHADHINNLTPCKNCTNYIHSQTVWAKNNPKSSNKLLLLNKNKECTKDTVGDIRILWFCTRRILHGIGRRTQHWPSCAELTKQCRNCKILQILFSNIALSSALTAATASILV